MFLKIIHIRDIPRDPTAEVLSRIALYTQEASDMITRSPELSSVGEKVLNEMIPLAAAKLRSASTQQRWAAVHPLLENIVWTHLNDPMSVFALLFDIEFFRTQNAKLRPTVRSPWNEHARFPGARDIINELVRTVTRNDKNCDQWKEWMQKEAKRLEREAREKEQTLTLKDAGLVRQEDGTFSRTAGAWGKNGRTERTLGTISVGILEEKLVRYFTHAIRDMVKMARKVTQMMDETFIIKSILEDPVTKKLTHTPISDLTEDILTKLEPHIVPDLKAARAKASDLEDLIEEYSSKKLSREDKRAFIAELNGMIHDLQNREHTLWRISGNMHRTRTIVINDRLRTIARIVHKDPLTTETFQRANMLCDSLSSAFTEDHPFVRTVTRIKAHIANIEEQQRSLIPFREHMKAHMTQLLRDHAQDIVPAMKELEQACTLTFSPENKLAEDARKMQHAAISVQRQIIEDMLLHFETVLSYKKSYPFTSIQALLLEWRNILDHHFDNQEKLGTGEKELQKEITALHQFISRSYRTVPRKLFVYERTKKSRKDTGPRT